MIIDHRTYTFHPRKIPEFLEIYEREGLPIQLNSPLIKSAPSDSLVP